MEIKIGTRKSKLALAQSNWVAEELKRIYPELKIEFVKITTKGDKILDVPLAKVGGKGLFVKEIEEALLRKDIDIAIHSLKDVPTELPEGLEVSIFPKREDFRDVLISKDGKKLKELEKGARVGTSSLRRKAQLMAYRDDICIESLRGNLDTRLKKLDEGLYDAIIVAAAGLNRLGLSGRATEFISPDIILPAIGQGALGIEFRSDDKEIKDILLSIHDEKTATCVRAERAFLLRLEGGCQVPIGALCEFVDEEQICLQGLVADESGQRVIKQSLKASKAEPEVLGERLADIILKKGADKILKEVYGDL